MSKLVLNDITSGYASITALNDNFALIENAFENTVSRDGTTPNSMSADLDMNGHGILNVTSLVVNGVDVSTLTDDAAAAAASAAAALVSETNAAASEVAAETAASQVVDWEYLGAWVTATPYKVNNIVYESTNGASYICLVDHTSGTFATDIEAGKWGLLALRGSAGAGTGDMLKSENLSGLANYATARSNLGLSIGTHVQAYDATLGALAGLNADAGLVEQTGADTFTKRAIGTASGNVPVVGTESATETVAGLSRRATPAEAQAGTDDTAYMTALKTKQALNATGAAPIYACRAWVNFNGTGTVAIRASGNVSSITDNGAGNYTANFGAAMPDVNYAVNVSMQKDSGTGNETGPSLLTINTTSVQVVNIGYDSAYRDSSVVCISVFR